jgi:uncharacterized protein
MSDTLGLDPQLLEILVCPTDHAALTVDPVGAALVCTVCQVAYPVQDGIAVMLPQANQGA